MTNFGLNCLFPLDSENGSHWSRMSLSNFQATNPCRIKSHVRFLRPFPEQRWVPTEDTCPQTCACSIPFIITMTLECLFLKHTLLKDTDCASLAFCLQHLEQALDWSSCLGSTWWGLCEKVGESGVQGEVLKTCYNYARNWATIITSYA